jgi:hypothetical protein
MSSTWNGIKVYDDSNVGELFDHAHKHGFELACEPRDYFKVPRGSIEGAPGSTITPFSRNDWPAMIEELAAKKARASDHWHRGGCKVLYQGQTNYCWFNGPVSAVYACRALNNQPFVELSPASGAAQIKNFRNDGGWGSEALEWLIKNGVNRASTWPPNAIDRRYMTAEAKAEALQYRVTEWSDLGNRNFALQATYALLSKAVAVGYNWWRHEVCQLDLVQIEPGSFGILIVNSWGPTWDGDGMAILREDKGTADDAVAPEVVHGTTLA